MRITTRQELIDVISQAMKDELKEITLYTVYGHLKQYHAKSYKLEGIHIGFPIYDNGTSNGEFLYYKTDYGYNHESIIDRNVTLNGEGNGYNDNWWYTTEEEAKDHINPKGKSIRSVHAALDTKDVSYSFFDTIISSLMHAPSSKIPLIKMVRMTTGLGLKESKDYVEYVIDRESKPETLGDILAEALKRH